ncbi:radical SAM protein [Oceanotoga teriensis]|uniref:radical SAM protein n=1 Tax=Oceanotoga teriensis TaxID=515440 RepID=UPI002713E34F|nr:radical SAM protein [Oceanotoga teriensis]MDO7977644.1 radical SAM protein [Oceanotoga teriensis]
MKKTIDLIKLNKTKSISLTGDYCYLNCSHCNKHYLKNMKTIKDIEALVKQGYKSFLLSGGMNNKLEIPINIHKNELRKLKEKYDLKYNAHFGFMNEENIIDIKDIIDTASIDIIGNKKTLEEVYHIKNYEESFKTIENIIKYEIPIKPHITIGLYKGQIYHEIEALEKLEKYIEYFDRIIFLVLIPTKGSKYENNLIPKIDEVLNIIKIAKKMYDDKKIILGCMHPKGTYRKDLQKNLIPYLDGLVQPLKETEILIKNMNYKINYKYECCAL